MAEITQSDVLALMPEGGNMLDILKACGFTYSLERKKCLNKLLYSMEKDGALRKHQPNPDRKLMWYRMRKPAPVLEDDDEGHVTAPET